jgi:hypothetical protein
VLLVDAVLFRGVELASDIIAEILLFKLLPPISIELNSAQGKLLFILGESTILPASVHAHDKLDLLLLI